MADRLISVFLAAALAVFTAGGCATQQAQEHKGAMTGAGVGAVTGGVVGGIIGHQSGHATEGVLLGALVGGLAGAAVGHYAYDQRQNEEQAKDNYAYSYEQAGANLVRIESVSAVPRSAKPGDRVELIATYTVLGPQGATMDVTETREVRMGGELQGKPAITVRRQGGTYQSKVPLILPADAPKGEYVVATTVQSGGSSDSRESKFTVE